MWYCYFTIVYITFGSLRGGVSDKSDRCYLITPTLEISQAGATWYWNCNRCLIGIPQELQSVHPAVEYQSISIQRNMDNSQEKIARIHIASVGIKTKTKYSLIKRLLVTRVQFDGCYTVKCECHSYKFERIEEGIKWLPTLSDHFWRKNYSGLNKVLTQAPLSGTMIT